MNKNLTTSMLLLAGQLATSAALAGDPHSVADYFHDTGRDATFDGRAVEYGKLFPDEDYRGTAEQNQRLLGITRLGDVLDGGGESPTANIHPSQPNATQLDFADEFGEWVPYRCQTISVPAEDPLIGAIDSLAQRSGTCCGINARCDHLGSDCLPFLRAQNRHCADHDRRLQKCGAPWYDLTSPCVVDAHRNLATSSTDPLLAAPFHAFSEVGNPLTPEDDTTVEQLPALPTGFPSVDSRSFPFDDMSTDFGLKSDLFSQPTRRLKESPDFPDSAADHAAPNFIPWASGIAVP